MYQLENDNLVIIKVIKLHFSDPACPVFQDLLCMGCSFLFRLPCVFWAPGSSNWRKWTIFPMGNVLYGLNLKIGPDIYLYFKKDLQMIQQRWCQFLHWTRNPTAHRRYGFRDLATAAYKKHLCFSWEEAQEGSTEKCDCQHCCFGVRFNGEKCIVECRWWYLLQSSFLDDVMNL